MDALVLLGDLERFLERAVIEPSTTSEYIWMKRR
jgi:hypothetical protein